MAYACGHPNKPHYSSGMCQNCYLAKYYQKKKKQKLPNDEKNKIQKDDTSSNCKSKIG